jgi:putative membrane protein
VIVLHTLARRWYVVAFLAGYFAASVPERGWKASVRFAVIAYGVALAAELSSTRNGFPFSHYSYTGATRGDEMYLSNVPAFVPAGYAVMIYAGRSLATFLSRRRLALIAFGAIATMAVDLVVDPVAVRGSQWFLGDLFHYATTRPWFGVPLANFGGWLLVAAVVIAIDLVAGPGEPIRPAVRGAVLGAAVIAFDIVVAFAIGATLVGFASLGVAGIILAAPLWARWTQRSRDPVT